MNITSNNINDINMDKEDANNINYIPTAVFNNQHNHPSTENLGSVYNPQKLPERNKRLNLSIAKEQLKNNPLHLNIN